MFRALAFAVSLVLVGGCSEYNVSQNPEEVEAVPPDIVVDPPALQFGDLADGETERQTFTVTNVGDGPLRIDGISVVSGISFSLTTPNLELSLEPGHSKKVEVEFQPFEGGDNFGQVMVFSNDPDSPEVPVDLLGGGLVPQLKITPDEHDFGASFIPCGSEVELTLENIGADDLVIEDFDYQSAGLLNFTHDLQLPLTLRPNEAVPAWVTFDAATTASDFGQLDVFSNDPRGVVSALQTGEGDYVDNSTDTYNVPVEPPVDILFAVDQSCSMDGEATALGNAFSNFITQINTVTTGWQVGVVTHDHGCFNNGVLSATTPNYASLFQAAVVDGTQETWSEALLALSDIALGQTGAGQCNANFLRPGAMLHVIVVSDEPEQSGTPYGDWITQLESYAPPGLFKISAVVDLGGCGTGPGGYDQAAMATGGELLNICNANWANNVAALANASLTGLNTFELTDIPELGSIEVRVDGTTWTTGWTYDPATNSIEFDDPQFQGGETVQVNYDVLAEC